MRHRIFRADNRRHTTRSWASLREGWPRRAAADPKAAAPIDLTGYWVSVVDEDWRFRMVVPPAGDYMGVPMTAEACKVADTWDPDKDEASGERCKFYGAPGLAARPRTSSHHLAG